MSEIHVLKVDELTPHPDNPRRGDIPAIMRSLDRFGQVKPIIVQRSTRYVVAGNHTLEAARRLGWPTIEAMVLDIPDDQARAYLLADNRTADKSTYDKGKLLDLLSGALELEGTGFTIDDAEDLQDELGSETEPEGEENITRAEPLQSPERVRKVLRREIILLMPQANVSEFADAVRALQDRYGTTTVVDTVFKAVVESAGKVEA